MAVSYNNPSALGYLEVAQDGETIVKIHDFSLVKTAGQNPLERIIIEMIRGEKASIYWLIAQCFGGLIEKGDEVFTASVSQMRASRWIAGVYPDPATEPRY